MALVGNTFYNTSAADPGTGYPMYYWAKTDLGTLWVRNTDDNEWILVGDVNQPYLGQLSTQGGNMQGAITGAHGLSSADTNNFTSSLYVASQAVTTKLYVDDQIAAVNAGIASSVTAALASVGSFSLSPRVAKARGTFDVVMDTSTTGFVIDVPVYTDGTLADEAECVWGAWIIRAFSDVGFSGGAMTFDLTETSNRVYTITASHPGVTGTQVKVGYFITAFRSS